jgi:hypothetical protein
VARSPQPLKRVFAADPVLAAWDERRRRESALTATVRAHLPRSLGERIRVAGAAPPELTLTADSGAVAAAARQRAPDLLAALRREGFEFTAIRVRVQVRATAPAAEKTLRKHLDGAATRPLAALARGLPAGPLRVSLERLLRRGG